MFTIEFDHLDWLSQFYSERGRNFEISQFEGAKVRVCNLGQNFKMTKTY